MSSGPINVSVVAYVTDGEAIRRIRDAVFVVEQGVPADLEHDDQDASAVHVLAYAGGEAVGTGRITAEGKIGRMAVLAAHRGTGVGRLILKELLGVGARAGLAQVYCYAQCHAIRFYEGLGFVAEGPVFLEAGIEHRRMTARPGATTTDSRT